MKYVVSNQGVPYVFPVTCNHDLFWDVLLEFRVIGAEGPKSAGVVNLLPNGKLRVVSGSQTLNIASSPERDAEDLQTLTDYLTFL